MSETVTRLVEIIQNKIPETVLEMWIGEVLYGCVCELAGIWFVSNKPGYTIGLICGMVLAMAGIYHLWWAIDKSFDKEEKDAGKFVGTQYGIRYALLIMTVAILYVTGWGNAFAAFIGYIGMKMAAYLQPFIHKKLRR